MALTSVKMTEEVWLACLSHALTTESEEIMGLLLGDIRHEANGGTVALIWGASPQVRSDRRKDRVETNPEQLAAASAQAERMTQTTGRTTRVIGWYHSHPHITVLPSHVDVRTQAMYQLLDSGFVGLIFSCFNEDSQKIGKIQVIAFQSLNRTQQHSSFVKKSSDNESALLFKDSGDSTVTKVDLSQEIKASGIDLSDMAANMQEALHLSNMDVSGAEYVRKEIPLQVLPNWSLFKFDSPLSSFAAVQHVLFQEEKSAYNQALMLNTRNGSMHPLAFVHHTSTYQATLCKLMEHCLVPAISVLQDRLKENKTQLALLEEEAKSLELEVLSRDRSPRG